MTTPKVSNGGKWAAIGAILLLALAIVAGLVYYHDRQKEEAPKVLTTEQVKDPDAVAKKVRVSQPAAQTIVREIERTSDEAPAITYYVQSPSLGKAAETVQRQIETKSPEAPAGVTAKSDRTIVTADKQLNKVDVYKINLNKAHKIKTGILFIDGKAYPSVGYQAGRWEGALHLDGQAVKGGTIMYTAIQW